jgi:hypothetical protein
MCLFAALDILEEFGISGILEHFSMKSKDLEVIVQILLVLFSCAFVKCPGLAFFTVSVVFALLLLSL